MKINVTFIESEYTDYVWVKPIPKPPTGGHKALKNEDFIDHDDLMFRISYYQQIVAKRIAERYLTSKTPPTQQTHQQEAFNKQMGIGRRHIIQDMPSEPLYRLPVAED